MPNHLLDTHVLIWLIMGDSRLSQEIGAIIRDPASISVVSVVSVWEIGIKVASGKLPPLFIEPDEFIHATDLIPLDVSLAHAKLAGRLPLIHRDPFDRMLVAQAQTEDLILITDDTRIERYDVTTLHP